MFHHRGHRGAQGNQTLDQAVASIQAGGRVERRLFVTIPIKGAAAVAVAAVIVAVAFIWLPAYRLFFLISIGAAVIVAVGLRLWHKLHPVKEDDVENKRPLGLS